MTTHTHMWMMRRRWRRWWWNLCCWSSPPWEKFTLLPNVIGLTIELYNSVEKHSSPLSRSNYASDWPPSTGQTISCLCVHVDNKISLRSLSQAPVNQSMQLVSGNFVNLPQIDNRQREGLGFFHILLERICLTISFNIYIPLGGQQCSRYYFPVFLNCPLQ